MNPLDLPGPQFLALYAVLFGVAVAAGIGLRSWLKSPGGSPSEPDLANLHPYDIACLSGGVEQATHAAIACLVQQKRLTVDAARWFQSTGQQPPATHPVEQAVLAAADEGGCDAIIARKQVAKHCEQSWARLRELELTPDSLQAWQIRLLPVIPLLALLGLGLAKLAVGLSRNRPTGFLTLALCGVGAALVYGVTRPVWSTRRGDEALELLQGANRALKTSVSQGGDHLAGQDIAFAVGLFGLGVLAAGPLLDLQNILRPPSTGDGGSSGGCGGGCGGGGCGGCGG